MSETIATVEDSDPYKILLAEYLEAAIQYTKEPRSMEEVDAFQREWRNKLPTVMHEQFDRDTKSQIEISGILNFLSRAPEGAKLRREMEKRLLPPDPEDED